MPIYRRLDGCWGQDPQPSPGYRLFSHPFCIVNSLVAVEHVKNNQSILPKYITQGLIF